MSSTLSPVATTTPSIVEVSVRAEATVMFAVEATRTESLMSRLCVIASAYPLVTASVELVGVGTVTVPVKVGEASGAKPEIDAPEGIVTVPVNVGEARFALRSRAVC